MKRWNGWGDESIELEVNPDALQFLQERIGAGTPMVEGKERLRYRSLQSRYVSPPPVWR